MYKLLIFFLCVLIVLGACTYDDNTTNINSLNSAYEPVLADRSILDNIYFTEAKSIVNPGKIYLYDKYILINEIDKGFHIIDNSNSKNPINVGFLSVLACRDVAIRDQILYCDNSNDLISIDLNDIKNPKLISRTKDVFPEREAPDNLPLKSEYNLKNRPANTVIIEWRKLK